MMTMHTYEWWRNATEKSVIGPIHEGEPQCGYYRYRNQPLAIWYDKEFGLIAAIKGEDVNPYDVWTFACKNPVKYDIFKAVFDGAKWPDEIEDVFTGNNGAPEHEAIADEIDVVKSSYNAWLESIKGKIETQEQADKAATYAETFAKLEKKATGIHKVEKEPHLEAGRKVDATWKPIIAKADDYKKDVKGDITSWMRTEEARRRALAEEAAQKAREEAEQIAKEAAAKGVEAVAPVIVQTVETAPVRAGNSARTVSMRSYDVIEIVDIKAAAAHIAALPNIPTEFVEVIEKIATRLLKAGADIPGAKLNKEMRAA